VAAEIVRVDGESAYVLHGYAYKETSLLVEAFTAGFGRLALVAKGARRPRSELRGLLQAFQPLALGWSGRGEVKSLVAADWRGGSGLPQGSALMSAFYLNELLLKLLPRDDPHPALYAQYEATLADLVAGADQPTLLRRFELRLLAELGYGLELARDVESGEPIVAEARYHYVIERGPVRTRERAAPGTRSFAPDPRSGASEPRSASDSRSSAPGSRSVAPGSRSAPGSTVTGATLLALSAGHFPDPRLAGEAKLLMREVLDHHLEQRALFSRRLIRDLQALESFSAEDR
jgi:DNA repair protein RecO (recombination protein O)